MKTYREHNKNPISNNSKDSDSVSDPSEYLNRVEVVKER